MIIGRIFGGVLLIAGTAIGAAMLALPIKMAGASLTAIVLSFLLGWAFMTISAFVLMEVNFWFKGDVNLITMTKHTLGLPGEITAWLSLLLLLYAINIAYISGCGPMIALSLHNLFGIDVSPHVISVIFSLFFAVFLYLGTGPVDYLNRVFMVGLILIYFLLVILGTPHIKMHHLVTASDGEKLLALAFPAIVTSFCFQFVIPSLKVYLSENIKYLSWTIIIGSTIPLIMYLFWTFLILGIIPFSGDVGLSTIAAQDNPTSAMSESLTQLFHQPWVPMGIHYFSLFALITSFLGVSLGLIDFLSDGLKVQKTQKNRLFLVILAIAPSLIIALSYPDSFMIALGYASVFVVILVSILPALMAWSGRYTKKTATGFRVPGGRLTLVLLLVLSAAVIIIHFGEQFDLFKPGYQGKLI